MHWSPLRARCCMGCRHAGRSRVAFYGLGGHALGYHAWKRGTAPLHNTPGIFTGTDSRKCLQILSQTDNGQAIQHIVSRVPCFSSRFGCKYIASSAGAVSPVMGDAFRSCRLLHFWTESEAAGGHLRDGSHLHSVILLLGLRLASGVLVRPQSSQGNAPGHLPFMMCCSISTIALTGSDASLFSSSIP